jgi:hypothetical protein
MRGLSTTAAMLIAAVLAIALVAYVFAGGRSGHRDSAPHCGSADALNLIKGELFRRAAGIGGSDAGALRNVANSSTVRTASRLTRRHHRGSDNVTCSGSIVVDLPAGVAIIGGRRSLAAQLEYVLAPRPGRGARLLALSKADAIVFPLATISRGDEQIDQPPMAEPAADEATDTAITPRTAPQAARASQGTRQAAPAPGPVVRPSNRPAQVKVAQARPATPPKAAPPRKPPAPAVTTPRVAPGPVASARPSFNCRYGRTRGELAVCANPGLASLDRQMAGQFYSALSAARPGQRAMLNRTRKRFLSYRDSCRSEACIADAYRGRMREISAIMNGRW